MYSMRDYQEKATELGIKHLTKANPAPFVLQLATGAGKSIIVANVAKSIGKKVLVLQPSKELVEQNYEKMMSYNPDFEVGIYSASVGRKDIGLVTYATIGSIVNKPELFMDVYAVIIDECHAVNPGNPGSQYIRFLTAIGCKRVMGLTATPYRLVQRQDGAKLAMINRIHPFFFKSIVFKIETDELIERGYLCPILYRRVHLDMTGLRINSSGSEYTEDSLLRFWRNDERLEKLASVIKMIDQHCQRNLIFCTSLEQAHNAKEMLSLMGVRAEVVQGDTPKKERARLVAEYKAGVFKHMLNVGVFTTGFDVPQLDSIVMARPTMSLGLYYQMVGRGVRIDPERPAKKLRVFDMVQLSMKLGRVETIKVQKELDPKTGKPTWKDEVVSESGKMTNVPLQNYAVK